MQDKDEFEAEMQHYLDKRPQHEDEATEETLSQEVHEDHDEDSQESEHEPAPKKESAIARLWQDLFGRDDEEPPQETQLMDDFKAVAKISLDVMKRLSEDERARLKESPEFTQFKDILKKYNIIK